MKSNFNTCLQLILKDEGGYGNDPADSGGPTNFGITLADYRSYINKKGTAQDVRRMTVDQAAEIYRERYWNAMDCDNLPSGVDYTVFDYAVNSGLGRPRADLKRYSSKSGADLINAITDERIDFLHKISGGKNSKFLKGWLSRVNRVQNTSLALAKRNNVTGPTVAAGSAGIFAVVANYLHAHPYTIAGVAIVGVVIGVIIHFIINKGKQ